MTVRYAAVACDYDGTLAFGGRVADATIQALERLRASGRLAVLVTGRELDDLQAVCPRLDLFERVVAENGAVVYRPSTRDIVALGDPPPEGFVQALRAERLEPFSVGRVIAATRTPHETTVLRLIREWGLELQLIFNKGAVMILPAGINKATGLQAALNELGLSPHNVVGIGDAENDHAFLSLCECGVAVAGALPMLAERADFSTRGDHGDGVVEVIDALIASDLAERDHCLTRRMVVVGADREGREVRMSPARHNVLVAGSSGAGKSTFATGLLERLTDQGYQICIIDPEGDYEAFEPAVALGAAQRPPSVDEILKALEQPGQHAVVNLVGLSLADRPAFFASLMPRLQSLRARTGRPHWIAIDEVHHLLPASWEPALLGLPGELMGVICITMYPREVADPLLKAIDTVLAVGPTAGETLREFWERRGQTSPGGPLPTVGLGEALFCSAGPVTSRPSLPTWLRPEPSRTQRRRHVKKYASGELAPDKSFYFEGAEGKLKLRAQNLILFVQLAQGVDDETWMHHLRRGDYSRWFREAIKDDDLADEAARIEEASVDLTPAESRARIQSAIETRYTAPASSSPSPDGERSSR